jgi:S-adenosylmethionine decarboxylase
MTGHHLTADLSGCPAAAPAMTDPQALRRLCIEAVRAAGLTPVGELFHVFPPPGGVTGVVLLAESHLAVHTWPERGAVTLDAFVCNISVDNSAAAQRLVDQLIAAFAPKHVQRQRWLRGAAFLPRASHATP